jgi:hypothetical protein
MSAASENDDPIPLGQLTFPQRGQDRGRVVRERRAQGFSIIAKHPRVVARLSHQQDDPVHATVSRLGLDAALQ